MSFLYAECNKRRFELMEMEIYLFAFKADASYLIHVESIVLKQDGIIHNYLLYIRPGPRFFKLFSAPTSHFKFRIVLPAF